MKQMITIAVFVLLAASAAFAQTPTAPSGVECIRTYDPVANQVMYSNEDLSSTVGEALPQNCLEYYIAYSKLDGLPVVDGKVAELAVRYSLENEYTMDMIDFILKNTPAKKTTVSIGFLFGGDQQGMNLIKVNLKLRPEVNP